MPFLFESGSVFRGLHPGSATGTKQRMVVGDDVRVPTKVFASSGAKCISYH